MPIALKGMFIMVMAVSMISYILRGNIICSDGLSYYAPLRSFAIDGDFDLTNEFRDYNPYHHAVPDFNKKTATGLVAEKYGIGAAILWSPFFYTAHAITRLCGGKTDGYSRYYQLFIGFGSLFYGIAGLLLIYCILRKFFEPQISIIAISCSIFGTNLLYYFLFEPAMSHLVSLFAITLFLFVVIHFHGRHTVESAILTGIACGLMMLVRLQNAAFVIVLLSELVTGKNSSSLLRTPRNCIVFFATTILTFMPQLLYWKIIFGSYFQYSYGSETFNFARPHLLLTMISPRHGLLYWTPLAGLALAGLFSFASSRYRFWGVPVLAVFLIQWYIGSSWWCWWFGCSFGQRIMVDVAGVFALGFAAVIKKVGDLKRGLQITIAAAALLLVLWNGILTVATAANNAAKNPLQIEWIQKHFKLNC
jgi:hypothetical protein